MRYFSGSPSTTTGDFMSYVDCDRNGDRRSECRDRGVAAGGVSTPFLVCDPTESLKLRDDELREETLTTGLGCRRVRSLLIVLDAFSTSFFPPRLIPAFESSIQTSFGSEKILSALNLEFSELSVYISLLALLSFSLSFEIGQLQLVFSLTFKTWTRVSLSSFVILHLVNM